MIPTSADCSIQHSFHSLHPNNGGRKRRRPWSIPSGRRSVVLATTISLLLASSPTRVDAQQVSPDPPVEIDVSPAPSPFDATTASTLQPTPLQTATTSTDAPASTPSPLVTILKEAFPLIFELVLNATNDADLVQLAKDVDGVLEAYLLEDLTLLEEDTLDIRDVTLEVSQRQRRRLRRQLPAAIRSISPFLRQRQLQQPSTGQEVSMRVTGNVIYDLDATKCVECVDQSIDSALSDALDPQLLTAILQQSNIEGVYGVNEVLPASALDLDNDNENDDDTPQTDSLEQQQQDLGDDNTNGLERPSTLSIVFGFILTAIAALGLCFYVYLFYRKRQRKLRKKRQQRQSIEYRTPTTPNSQYHPSSPNVNGNRPTPTKFNVTPTKKIHDDDNDDDEDSEGSSFKGIDSADSQDEPQDSFAQELQLAASLDQQAWDEFQRKKGDLNKNQVQVKNTSSSPPLPEAKPEAPSDPRAWAKSFPYGDESSQVIEEQGVELTVANLGSSEDHAESGSWEPYSSSISPEEKKDEWGMDRAATTTAAAASRDPEPGGRLDPDPDTTAVMQSIERTLSQYGAKNFAIEDNIAPEEAIDEVARLSRFVQRYEKRRERQKTTQQQSAGGSGHSRSVSESGRSPPQTNGDPQGMRGSFLQRLTSPRNQTDNTRNSNQAKTAPTRQNETPQKGHENKNQNDDDDAKPRISTYTGITMTGALYQDASMQNVANNNRGFASGSDDSEDDSYRDDDGSLISQRLGITPFSVQRPESGSFDSNSPSGNGARGPLGFHGSPNMPMEERMSGQQRRPQSEGGAAAAAARTQKANLSQLRTSDAIVDKARSDVNVGYFPSPGMATPSPDSQRAARTPAAKKTTPNPRFNKLRNLFEDKSNGAAIFPPGENWQSGVSKN